jgi:hypothetical protein
MNRTKTNRAGGNESGMNHAALDHGAIDRILATEEPLIPSSGFLASVMESVREEAAAPQPIPFPWKRAIPGVIVVAGVFGWGAFRIVRQGLPAIGSVSGAPLHIPAAAIQPAEQAGWVAVALGVSLLSWLFSRRLAGRSGLL